MRIVHLTSVHPYNDTRVFHRECRTLALAGHDVTLIAPQRRLDETVSGVRVLFVLKPNNRLWRILFTDWQVFFRAIVERADVYHFHDPELVLVGLLLKLVTGAHVIYDVHEDNPSAILERDWIPGPLRKWLSRGFGNVERLVARFFDAIITADDAVALHFEGANKKIVTLFNFPLKAMYDSRLHRVHSPLESKPVSLVYVGVMGRIRGLWLMLNAVEILLRDRHLNVELVLAGEIFDVHEAADFRAYLEENEILKGRVHWLGRVPQSEVVKLLSEADVGWVPLAPIAKFYKNIPTKLFEYMACGLPVVGSDLPPIRRFVQDAQAGLLAAPADPQAHADQILCLVQNPELARQMGERGYRAFLEEYNWESEGQKLLHLYNYLMEH